MALLLVCGTIGVALWLNMKTGPSYGTGVLPDDAPREARERDYFFVLGFWSWGMLAGAGIASLAASLAKRLPNAFAAAVLALAAVPLLANSTVMDRTREPLASLPRLYGQLLLDAVPMGGVLVRKHIHDAFMTVPDHVIELFHGYTYSGHPLAAAAAIAALDIYRDERLFERAATLEPVWADAMMTLRDEPNVLDIRTLGLVAGIDLAPRAEGAGKRGYEAMDHAFREQGLMIRFTGDTLALTPPLIITEEQIGEMVEKVRAVIRAVAG